MGATKGRPWDDWWDNLASQGLWTLPESISRRARPSPPPPSGEPGALSPPPTARPAEKVTVAWREIEELHAMISELDEERRRLEEAVATTQKALEENGRLKATLEFVENENLSLRREIVLLRSRQSR